MGICESCTERKSGSEDAEGIIANEQKNLMYQKSELRQQILLFNRRSTDHQIAPNTFLRCLSELHLNDYPINRAGSPIQNFYKRFLDEDTGNYNTRKLIILAILLSNVNDKEKRLFEVADVDCVHHLSKENVLELFNDIFNVIESLNKWAQEKSKTDISKYTDYFTQERLNSAAQHATKEVTAGKDEVIAAEFIANLQKLGWVKTPTTLRGFLLSVRLEGEPAR